MFATLLSNHDPFAGDRPFTRFNGNIEKCKLAASALLVGPGIPFIYFGEEIGMANYTPGEDLPWDDAKMRIPMQWSDEHYAGFTTSDYTWLSLITGKQDKPCINANYTQYNVAAQENDSNSLLSHYKKMINIRKSNQSLNQGSYQQLYDDQSVFAYIRKFGEQAVIVVINFTGYN